MKYSNMGVECFTQNVQSANQIGFMYNPYNALFNSNNFFVAIE